MVGFEVGVFFDRNKQAAKGTANTGLCLLEGSEFFGRQIGRVYGHRGSLGACVHNGLQGLAFEVGVPFNGIDQIGDQVGAALVGTFYIGPLAGGALVQGHQIVVPSYAPKKNENQKTENREKDDRAT